MGIKKEIIRNDKYSFLEWWICGIILIGINVACHARKNVPVENNFSTMGEMRPSHEIQRKEITVIEIPLEQPEKNVHQFLLNGSERQVDLHFVGPLRGEEFPEYGLLVSVYVDEIGSGINESKIVYKDLRGNDKEVISGMPLIREPLSTFQLQHVDEYHMPVQSGKEGRQFVVPRRSSTTLTIVPAEGVAALCVKIIIYDPNRRYVLQMCKIYWQMSYSIPEASGFESKSTWPYLPSGKITNIRRINKKVVNMYRQLIIGYMRLLIQHEGEKDKSYYAKLLDREMENLGKQVEKARKLASQLHGSPFEQEAKSCVNSCSCYLTIAQLEYALCEVETSLKQPDCNYEEERKILEKIRRESADVKSSLTKGESTPLLLEDCEQLLKQHSRVKAKLGKITAQILRSIEDIRNSAICNYYQVREYIRQAEAPYKMHEALSEIWELGKEEDSAMQAYKKLQGTALEAEAAEYITVYSLYKCMGGLAYVLYQIETAIKNDNTPLDTVAELLKHSELYGKKVKELLAVVGPLDAVQREDVATTMNAYHAIPAKIEKWRFDKVEKRFQDLSDMLDEQEKEWLVSGKELFREYEDKALKDGRSISPSSFLYKLIWDNEDKLLDKWAEISECIQERDKPKIEQNTKEILKLIGQARSAFDQLKELGARPFIEGACQHMLTATLAAKQSLLYREAPTQH